jgi:hypothetical protein
LGPHVKKRKYKKIYSEENQKIIAVRRGCWRVQLVEEVKKYKD